MKKQCPHFKSKKHRLNIIHHGFYRRSSDSKKVRRFDCKLCCLHFSQATFRLTYRQKKRRIHSVVKKLLCSGVTQRRAAKILQINRKIVVRKLHLLAQHAEKEHQTARNRYGYRKDERPQAWNLLMKTLIPVLKANAVLTSDQNLHDPKPLRTYFPQAQHCAVQGRRAVSPDKGSFKKKRVRLPLITPVPCEEPI